METFSQPAPDASAKGAAAAPCEVLHYLGYDDDRGGIVSALRAQAASGHFRSVLGLNRGARQTRQPPMPSAEFSPLRGETISLGQLWRARTVAREVQRWLDASPERFFHGHSRAGLLVALWLKRRGEKRFAVSVHCYGKQRWFYRWAKRQLDSRLFWLTPAMQTHYGLGRGDWSQCRPNGIAGAWAKEFRRPTTRSLRLGAAGALVSWKGWHLVLDALARLPVNTREQITFNHIGAEEPTEDSRRYASALRAQTDALGLVDRVRWLGPQGDSSALLAASDVVLVPSEAEPFSMIMLEALQSGLPVLASDAGGPADVLTPRRHGWLFPSGNAAALAAQLEQLLSPAAWSELQLDADLAEKFSAEKIAATWAASYRELSR